MSTDAITQVFTRQTERFAKNLLVIARQPDKSIEDLSKLVHDFYESMKDRFENFQDYNPSPQSPVAIISSSLSAAAAAVVSAQASRSSPTRLSSSQPNHSHDDNNDKNEQWETLSDIIERVLNEYIYQDISARIINEDEEKVMAFQRRIRSLNWITIEHLEIDIDFKHPLVHDLLDRAICQMIEMNSRQTSLDKLHCIVQCSKTILELLQVNQTKGRSNPVSADQFLPVFVFVVIQANPPMLPVDMKYLTKFSNPRRLMSGETGYYFTNLCCALEFIEKISGSSLNISEEDFNKFVNGEAIPETKSQFSTYLCDGLRTICSNEATLNDLRLRQEVRQSNLDRLFEKVDVHLETNRAKLKEMQVFAANLKQKLTPNFPKFYSDLLKQNKEFAHRLLPNYLRPSKPLQLVPEAKLIDIGDSEPDSSDKTEL